MKSLLVGLFFACTLNVFAQTTEKIEADKDYVITLKTSFGNMTVLLSDNAPLHKANFVKLVKSGFYDSTTFHRVIDGFMIQGGDTLSKDNIPTNDGMGNMGYTIPAELTSGLKHKKGVIAAARIGDQANPQRASNGSQFYIVLDDQGASHLDGQYSVFGQVIDGFEVMRKIAAQQTDNRNRPLENIYMTMTADRMKRTKIVKKYKVNSFYEGK
jgi:cyclophilin family peptidyl-prolyl cis-trans isomerase